MQTFRHNNLSCSRSPVLSLSWRRGVGFWWKKNANQLHSVSSLEYFAAVDFMFCKKRTFKDRKGCKKVINCHLPEKIWLYSNCQIEIHGVNFQEGSHQRGTHGISTYGRAILVSGLLVGIWPVINSEIWALKSFSAREGWRVDDRPTAHANKYPFVW